MMYKCVECGCEFDESEIWEWSEAHGERFAGCPDCGGDYEELRSCKGCGCDFLDEELSWKGYCVDCLRNMLTVDMFLDFCCDQFPLYNGESGTLEEFMLTEVFGLSAYSVPKQSTQAFRDHLALTYKRIVASEKLLGQANKMQERIDHYMTTVPSLWDEWYEYVQADDTEKGVK